MSSTISLSPEHDDWRFEADFSGPRDVVQLSRRAPDNTTCTRLWHREEDIGQGHFGEVYIQRYTDPDTGEAYRRAVKEIAVRIYKGRTKYLTAELRALIIARDVRYI
jgi:hypothetical protein